jgi:outer membrane protein OmpA-like peptidoglycan-associated protein
LAAALLATGCTDALTADGKAKDDGGSGANGNSTALVTKWPQTKLAGTATSPVVPDISIGVHDVIRSADGFSTVLLDVENQGNDDRSLFDMVGSDTLEDVTLLDARAKIRYTPLQLADGAGTCMCSGDTRLIAGTTTTLYATYADLPEDIGKVRIGVPGFTPVDGVGVEGVGDFKAGDTATMAVEADEDLSVHVKSVSRGDKDGAVVSLEYRNAGADPLYTSEWPRPDTIVLVDPVKLVTYQVRSATSSPVMSETPDDQIDGGQSFTVDLLTAPLPDGVDEVVVRGRGLRRSFPVSVSDKPADPSFQVTSALDDPGTYQLVQDSSRYRTEAVSMAKPSDIAVDETGPELPLGERVGTLTSPAQPGWTFAPRQVVRVNDEQSYLIIDMTRSGSSDSWPESVTENFNSDLRSLALIDPKTDQRLGVLVGQSDALSSDYDDGIEDGETHTMFAAFPAPDKGSSEVTVDIPSFGRLDGVPVVDGPDLAGKSDPVQATMRVSADGRLRMDVLSVGRMSNDGGTLVRVRMVNESNPDGVNTPFGFPGFEDLCRVTLVNPDNNDRFYALDPCIATAWQRDLGSDDSLVFEARFPNVPDGVERMVVVSDGYVPSAPVPFADSASPWYLDLPRDAGDPIGDTLQGSVGVADDLQTEVRSGNEVEVNLNTDLLFEFGSSTLSADAKTRLTEVAQRLTDDASGTVTITGHTDSIGDDAGNLTLSQQRADAVKTALAEVTGPTLVLEVDAKGEAEPVAPNDIEGRDNPDGRARNRRVTVSYTAA